MRDSIRDLMRVDARRRKRGAFTHLSDLYDRDRPKTRADCVNGPRPCPWVRCRYHLFLNVYDNGSIEYPFGDDLQALYTMPQTCALDVADKGGWSIGKIAQFYGHTRSNVNGMIKQIRTKVQRLCVGASPFGKLKSHLKKD